MKEMTMSEIRFSVVGMILVVCSYIAVNVETTHQRWWLYGCQCANWESRKSVRDVVMNSYRGLFVNKDALSKLPVVKLHRNPGESGMQSYVANTLPNLNRYINPGCCSTEYRYEYFNTTSADTEEYKVVHFEKAFQFVPTGRCRENSTCRRGECLQMYRRHWMLVWDEQLSKYPPVTFLPVEVPSHCQCVNIGRDSRRLKRSCNNCADSASEESLSSVEEAYSEESYPG